MRYTSDMWEKPLGCAEVLTHLYNYLDFLHCKFLTQRLIHQDTGRGYSHPLISVAEEVLSTLLVLNEERDRVRGVTTDLAPIVRAVRYSNPAPLMKKLSFSPMDFQVLKPSSLTCFIMTLVP